MRPVLPRLACILACLAVAGACTPLPADPEHTLERVRGGVMRVGVVDDPPLIHAGADGSPTGREIQALQMLARELQARIEWHPGTHDRLMEGLDAFRLDLVVGGTEVDSPWQDHVALSQAYRVSAPDGMPVMRVMGLPPGENGWRREVERFMARDAVRHVLQADAPRP